MQVRFFFQSEKVWFIYLFPFQNDCLAQWKPLLARIVNVANDDRDMDEKDRTKPRAFLKLIDANSEEVINI